jgi:hypothetical protein
MPQLLSLAPEVFELLLSFLSSPILQQRIKILRVWAGSALFNEGAYCDRRRQVYQLPSPGNKSFVRDAYIPSSRQVITGQLLFF